MTVHISRALVDALLADAARTPAVEVCGLLFGTNDRVTAIEPCANVADNPATRFELDPSALIAAHKAARAGGATLIGHYHSHPDGVCAPSRIDQAAADAVASLWIIVTQREVAAFMLARDAVPRAIALEIC